MGQLQLWDSCQYQRPRSEMVLSKDCAVFALFVFGISWPMEYSFEFDSSHFLGLGSNRSLANRVDATVEVVLARSQNCPPDLRADLHNKGGYASITTF